MNRKQWNWQRSRRKIPAVVAILVIAWACVGVTGPASAEESIQDLKATIEQLTQSIQLDDQKRIAGEIKMLRRLIKHGVLNKREYEKIKSRLFKMTDR